ncbi:MAG: hypothetical protein ACF8SC_11255 [Phycisphaerales bacterium JB037]
MSGIDPLASARPPVSTPPQLRQVNALLRQFGQSIRPSPPSLDRVDLSGVQSRIDEIVARIPLDPIESNRDPENDLFRMSGLPAGVTASFEKVHFDGAESFPIEIVVTDSAQRAELFLDLGGQSIDLAGEDPAPARAFRIAITGPIGTQELAFSSGMSVRHIADTINAFREVTGVWGDRGSGGISLHSEDFGGQAFVSVEVIDDGGIDSRGIIARDAGDWVGWQRDKQPISELRTGLTATDRGNSVGVLVNGERAESDGFDIAIKLPNLVGTIQLDPNFIYPYRTGEISVFHIVPRFPQQPNPNGTAIDRLA